MRARELEKNGIVLLREEKGESFWSVAFLSAESGLEYFLMRRSSRKTRPDLFDSASIQQDRPKNSGPGFISEYRVTQRRTGIGESFSRIRMASRFANLLRRNTLHLADTNPVIPICERFFDAAARGTDLQAAYLKALYLFASTEGFPLKEDWAATLRKQEREDLGSVLRNPLGEQEVAAESTEILCKSLESWLVREAHFSIDL